jgi:2-keto-3-deoxy-L-rhamnonate aldolase RhmA
MSAPRPQPSEFRQRFAAGEQLIGTFVKTPTTHATEIFGDLGYDFIVIDEEHAPVNRESIDTMLLAARASNIAGIVRVASATADALLSVLDCGAVGALVPHVSSAAKAREVVAACRFRGGKRGYSGSVRAARYGGTPMWTNIDAADKATTVIAMIEDPEALDVIDDIVAVEGLDGVFIGRGDLTAAFGAPKNDAPVVQDAVERITAAARKAGKPVCVMVNNAAEAKPFQALGATAFIVATDQSFMRRAAAQAQTEFAALKK